MSGRALGVATSNIDADVIAHTTGGTAGFYGTTPISQETVAATTTTTATTTALQVDIDAIRTALQNLGLIG
jgi:hypothetical protein